MTHFGDLLAAATNGEKVEIAVPDKPTLKLVVAEPTPPAHATGPRILGSLRGQAHVPSEEEWAEMDKELEHLMNDAPLTSQGDH